jgi:hypothetical protein
MEIKYSRDENTILTIYDLTTTKKEIKKNTASGHTQSLSKPNVGVSEICFLSSLLFLSSESKRLIVYYY